MQRQISITKYVRGEILSILLLSCKTELIKEDVDLHRMDNTPPAEFSEISVNVNIWALLFYGFCFLSASKKGYIIMFQAN